MTNIAHNNSDLIHVSALNQYLYCPRRLWYYRFYNPNDRSSDLVKGQAKHRSQARREQQFREQYFAAPVISLHGRVDLLETDSEQDSQTLTPVERKRASSGQYYWNDEVQLAGYCMLIEHATPDVENIDSGIIYLYSTDQRHEVRITEKHRNAVSSTIESIRDLAPGSPPDIVDNSNKCQGCSIRHRCLPTTVSKFESATNKASEGITHD
ncbi:CRISPR-associated protein Cas4 [Salinarchaeum sp. IM2453]|uniref:CRISPR-associated protein Cas4 n=1 Tax=Salinarchaeum sp. IM2453 TaxID=2862870 RepID=UPI001C82DE0E|nr:CRISPR-associated protein Cas4 [Salinarchaeum sp. IM2453]QZA89526.1 CRISPR-associated protein Cas4 [Salinarchaeum sp. IM2453]